MVKLVFQDSNDDSMNSAGTNGKSWDKILSLLHSLEENKLQKNVRI